MRTWIAQVRCFVGFILLLGLALPAFSQSINLHIEDVLAPSFSLKNLQAQFDSAHTSRLRLTIAEAQILGRRWQKLALDCTRLALAPGLVECAHGTLDVGERLPFTFRYRQAATGIMVLNLLPAPGEQWQLQTHSALGKTEATLTVSKGKLSRLNPALEGTGLSFKSGTLTADAHLSLNAGVATQLTMKLGVNEGVFGDQAGSRAGEKLNLSTDLQAQAGTVWRWQSFIHWYSGEVYWQPFYFASGDRQLRAQGSLEAQRVTLQQATLDWKDIGQVRAQGDWDRANNKLDNLHLSGQGLALNGLYTTFLKPWLPEGQMSKLQWTGRGDVQLQMLQGAITTVDANLHDASVKPESGGFELAGIQAALAWSPTQARASQIDVARGTIGKLPLGKFQIRANLAPQQISIAPITLPILDGALRVDGIDARRTAQDWRWTVSAALQPISMQQLSAALDLPVMHGTLSAVIPQLSYENQALSVGGALLFKVFDGSIVVKDLSARDLSGPAPSVRANIDMRNLDLDLLTRTFSFGAMQGRLDVTVHDLELFGWRPVQFDARVASSPGDYPRKISQKAVQNITALSGGGGVAAIQKSFLRFFDEFGYERIGLSCKLRNGICEMGGIENQAQGYLIVKGGGIPSLSVIGYNRQVGWDELLARIKAATQGGKPIVQ